VCDYGCNYAKFLFDVLHASPYAIKSQDERLRFPESQKRAKKCKMEEQIANVDEMLLFVGIFEGLH